MAEHPKLPAALVGVTYPAARAALVAKATELNADAATLATLNALPDVPYASEEAVIEAARALP